MIKKVGVVGAGMMGAEIALCFTREGYETILWDITPELVEKGREKQAAILDKNIAKGRMEASRKEEILANLKLTTDMTDFADCDIIFEAVVEKLEVKNSVFQKLDTICKESTIICSNTSSISITKMAAAVSKERMTRFIGTHYNSPASVMKLVEVIPALLTTEETTNEVYALLASIGKEPVRVKDVVGFALNRIFHCMYLEALRLIEEGVCSAEDVDKVCKYGLGHPVGVCSLLDITGHDLNNMVDQILFDAYGERFRPSPQIQRLVDSGMLGRKTGAGFFKYDK